MSASSISFTRFQYALNGFEGFFTTKNIQWPTDLTFELSEKIKTFGDQASGTVSGVEYVQDLGNGVRTNLFGYNSIYVNKIARDANHSSGFGTKMTRAIVELSLKRGFKGQFCITASYSSHLFWLYMGMIPFVEEKLGYIEAQFGFIGQRALEEWETVLKKKIESRKPIQSNQLDTVKMLLGMPEDGIIDASNVNEITNQIEKLKSKTVSYISLFISQLLDELENCHGQFLNTDHWGAENMRMSKMGLQRWRAAIASNKPFIPFKDFAHLHPYMTEREKRRLETIWKSNESDFKQSV